MNYEGMLLAIVLVWGLIHMIVSVVEFTDEMQFRHYHSGRKYGTFRRLWGHSSEYTLFGKIVISILMICFASTGCLLYLLGDLYCIAMYKKR